jgi:hypothetical protein
MEKFDYKVLWNRMHGLHQDWFDGEENLGSEITSDLLARYSEEGWEVAATMQVTGGGTHKILLKRRR